MRSDRLSPLLKHRTFARNVVSGLVLGGIAAPISVHPTFGHVECERIACRTRSRWLDTRLVGNTIDSRRDGGIWVGWVNDNGDALRRVTIVGNQIHLGRKGVGVGLPQGSGVDLAVGINGSSDNRISDALVAYNTIEMGGGANAVKVLAGQGGRSGNVVENVRIVGNAVRFSGAPRGGQTGVAIFVSDGCWGYDIPCQNVVRRIEVVGNVLEGHSVGVRVGEPCCEGSRGNTLTNVRIAANVIKGIISAPTQFLNPWGVVIAGLSSPSVSKVSVDSNTIVQSTSEAKTYAAYLTAGGIAVLGGLESNKSVRGVSVTNNRVATKLMGIVVLGGGPSFTGVDEGNVIGNRVSRVKLRGNVITREPVLATRWDSRIKGISLIGGLGGAGRPNPRWRATGNTVACVTVRDNIVAGKRNDVAVLPNLGAGASGNVARVGGC